MKKIIALILALLVITIPALAFGLDLPAMTDDELTALRQSINDEQAGRKRTETTTPTDGTQTLRDIFPDVELAKIVRDKIGKISIDQNVNQDELDTITRILDGNKISDLTGISYLRKLTHFSANGGNFVSLPEEMFTITTLRSIRIPKSKLEVIPEAIGNLSNLEFLGISQTKIKSIPDSICNLTMLTTLRLADTAVSSLPSDIGNLTNLKELDISKTKITSLPSSIHNLDLETFKRKGLDLE